MAGRVPREPSSPPFAGADSLVVRSQIAVEIGVQETEVLHTQGVNVGAAVGEPGDIPPKVVVDLHCDADQVVPDRTCLVQVKVTQGGLLQRPCLLATDGSKMTRLAAVSTKVFACLALSPWVAAISTIATGRGGRGFRGGLLVCGATSSQEVGWGLLSQG